MPHRPTGTPHAAALTALGLAIAAMGLVVANADDAPGSAILGCVLLVTAVVLAVRIARHRMPTWAVRAALAAGVVIAAGAAFLTHAATITAPLFADAADVPSVTDPVPPPQWSTAVDRAQTLVRAAIMDQNLPGLSIAVASSGGILWAEGFGWRDVGTQTRVTPETRFNLGSASSVVMAADVASLGLKNTGADSASAWSPEAIGEPGEDFPGFTFLRHKILQPIGLASPEYPLPGNRATFYVPTTFWRDSTTDPRRGRRLMPMHDLTCCPGGKAFYSTPSDLARLASATHADRVDGDMAGGSVLSLVTRRDNGVVVAVASNIAYANTSALAGHVADAFASPK
jgi:CubicO group peptidase (beta-lactamase class C family)